MNIQKFKIKEIALALCLLTSTIALSQVGIGTAHPDPSSLLDLKSNSQGLLAPRMTTLERTTIVSPAESLLVFDTNEKSFYFYNTTNASWTKLANDMSSAKRNNYKLIKSVTDLATELVAGGGSSYKLDQNTYYEINGRINLAHPIELNDAYVSGLDANEDMLSATGTVFKGNKGGSIKNVTLKGAKAFDITGPGTASNSTLLIQNTIIEGMTSSVGNIGNLGLVFSNIVNFINNNNGITYSSIGNLLLNNQAWMDNNQGTYEKFTGTFGLIEKVSGFSTVKGSAVALDVSTNGLIVITGVLQGTVFSGTSSAPYVNGYTTGSYPGYNFSNAWSVAAPGIPRESDDVSTGDINLSAPVGSGATTTFSGTGSGSRKKIEGTTTSNNLFRFKKEENNRIIYQGNKPRFFQLAASISFQTSSDSFTAILYIAKNGVVIDQTKVYGRGSSSIFTPSDILALPIIGSVELKKSDYIEVWAERNSGIGNMETLSLNLTVR
ncbi:hypothetical protein [Gelidibacter sp.]|uniref:hypothetical protein n=1 Tax=Gelidibacter sp. TaxID=2018083 RepID=UPI002B9301CE|nr:hypothetical protein [Gelidibacter sp.]HUH27371.1 hypothetical protein [Gelidibacter sp.]